MIRQPRGPLAPGRSGAADRPQGPPPPASILEAGQSFHTHRGSLAHDDLIGRPEGSVVVSSGGTPYLALRPLLADYTLSMPRGAAVVYPKDAGADRGPGRHLRRGPGRRGRGGLGRAVLLAAARGRRGRAARLLRAQAGLRRDRPGQRRALLRRAASGLAAVPASSRRRAVGILRAADELAPADDGEAFDRVVLDMLAPWEYADAAAARSGARRPGLLLRRHHHAAVPHRGGAARRRAASPSPPPGSRCCAAGTSTASPSGPSTGWSGTPDSWSPPAGWPTG